ncbi:hypothetical protein ZWY2020_030340 [Hordeum vulgare]|nr:hypothetical protein ZWY2020_030340 [Hordeum vulgare]
MSLLHQLAAGEIFTILRGAASPSSALRLYSLLRLRLPPSDPSFVGRAAVFALKSLSSAVSLPLISHFHAHLIRSNLLAYPQVASSLLLSYTLFSTSAAHHLFDQTPPASCHLQPVCCQRHAFVPVCGHSGLAGQLEDAYDVIKTTRVEANIIIWTSLLAACKRLKNFHIAMEGLEKVLAMEISDENDGLYTCMPWVGGGMIYGRLGD